LEASTGYRFKLSFNNLPEVSGHRDADLPQVWRMIYTSRKLFRYLVSRADAARDERRFGDAAALYEEALRLNPSHAAIRIQCGHMHKEAGQRAQAELHYAEAWRLVPGDADLALQLGHFYKGDGRLEQARQAYRRAVDLAPDWPVAREELAALETAILQAESDGSAARTIMAAPAPAFSRFSAEQISRLVPPLTPAPRPLAPESLSEALVVRRLGRPEAGFWGRLSTLRGIEAVRGYAISEVPVTDVEVFLNGIRIHHGRISEGHALPEGTGPRPLGKYIFNQWVDFSNVPLGAYTLEICVIDALEGRRWHKERIAVGEPPLEEDWPDSDFVVQPLAGDVRSLEEQIRTRPSMVRTARRQLFPDGIRNALVMRMDQLGDLVASIPAIRRLRELMPDACLVGLFTPANADLAATLGLLDEVIVADFPDDRVERRRVMSLEAQEELRARLSSYEFDVAIDLSQSGTSRPLLHLTGAKFTHATAGSEWSTLSSEFVSNTHDRWTLHDCTPHSTKVLALVESFGALLNSRASVIRRSDLLRTRLAPYGIAAEDRFMVIHTGARIRFSQWPGYGALVEALLRRTSLHIVLIGEDPSVEQALAAEILEESRLHVVHGRLPFDDFDALLSFATVVIGNDSGPKHLASLRGTPTVTLFSARINWTEWAQENVGTVISRRLPCAGCAILHDADECGRGFACVTDIKVDEVVDAALAYVEAEDRA
jgi:ADP-heptose:LPS heptosyltransferase